MVTVWCQAVCLQGFLGVLAVGQLGMTERRQSRLVPGQRGDEACLVEVGARHLDKVSPPEAQKVTLFLRPPQGRLKGEHVVLSHPRLRLGHKEAPD